MSTRVDFYIINAQDQQTKLGFVCRLLEKAYKQNNKVFVHCDSQQQAHALDELLWTFKDISFIPHNLVGEGPDPAPTIQLGYQDIPAGHRDVLLNLNTTVINEPRQFRRIIEVIANNETDKQMARDRYRHYREQTCQLHSHDLTKSD